MLMMEEILLEMHGGDTNEQGLPPGYRFHPTDEELVTFYLASKVLNGSFTGVEIAEIDLNRCEPWELPDAGKIGEREWYFFSSRDRKYPTGLRTNRATEAGYWKATGKDKEVYSASSGALLGMKKTLVFYKGRAPRGEKTKWVMHEYRLVADLSSLRTSKEEWVICRIHHKAVVEKTRATPLPLLSHQLQSFPVEEASSSQCMINFPPLLDNSTMSSVLMEDAPPSINNNNSNNNNNDNQNPHLIHQENDPRTSFNISNIISHQPYCISYPHSISSATITNPSPSIVFKTLLSRQDYHFEEPAAAAAAAAKERMMNISCNFQEVDPNNNNNNDNDNNVNWVDKIQQNSVFFEVNGSGGLGLLPAFSAVTDTADNELSTSSVAFNRSGFQMLLDSHIRGHGQLSGCLDL